MRGIKPWYEYGMNIGINDSVCIYLYTCVFIGGRDCSGGRSLAIVGC